MAIDTSERHINPYTDFGFKNLFEQAEIAKYSETERRQYEESKKVFWDNYSVIQTAQEKGKREGLLEGARKEKAEIIQRMKAEGMTSELISKYTGLSIEEIETL